METSVFSVRANDHQQKTSVSNMIPVVAIRGHDVTIRFHVELNQSWSRAAIQFNIPPHQKVATRTPSDSDLTGELEFDFDLSLETSSEASELSSIVFDVAISDVLKRVQIKLTSAPRVSILFRGDELVMTQKTG
jgi:hypothetical protein